ncbi:Medium-chain acyl-CoA ligase ACSF2, mitochondrial, partial [Lamellibrachia satsuma]
MKSILWIQAKMAATSGGATSWSLCVQGRPVGLSRNKADKLAAGLLSLGVRKGDRVGIWSHNCPEWILVQYATARAGMILVNVNPSYQAAELEYALRK